jgi:hypothetical protein
MLSTRTVDSRYGGPNWRSHRGVIVLSLEAEEQIERRPEEVFRFVATNHFRNHPKWDPSITEMTPISAGPMRVEATAWLVRNHRGKRVEGTLEVTEYEPERLFAAVSRFGPLTLHQQATCEPLGSGRTRLHLRIDTDARGPLKLLLRLMRTRFRKTMATSLLTIKRCVEQG